MTPERLQAGMEGMAAMAQSAFSSPVAGEAKAPTRSPAVCVDPLSLLQAGVDKEELKLALRLKEVDLETKTREVELMYLRIRALELEKATEASTPSRGLKRIRYPLLFYGILEHHSRLLYQTFCHLSFSAPAAVGSPAVFPACAVTRSQLRKFDDVMDLSDAALFAVGPKKIEPRLDSCEKPVTANLLPTAADLSFAVNKTELIHEQQTDPSLATCLSSVTSSDKTGPCAFAHYSVSGHLGIRKTYQRILRYFFWPGLKADVAKFCRTCHVYTPSRTSVLSHDIDVADYSPIKQHAYRVNPTKRAVLQQEVIYLLENGLAVPSSSA
ncbi:hypothetical protein Q8A73_002830 [Channa argus]|nr:hypothetical protein Q8A73_002830 [Channa argus]